MVPRGKDRASEKASRDVLGLHRRTRGLKGSMIDGSPRIEVSRMDLQDGASSATTSAGVPTKTCSYVYGGSDNPVHCTSRVFRRGFCRRHGTTSRCGVQDCPKGSVVKGYCIAHARERCGNDVMEDHYKNRKRAKCETADCTKYMQWKGLCIPHARERFGDERVDEHFSRKGSACNAEGCSKRKVYQGYCIEHARANHNAEDLEQYIRNKSQHLCSVKECFERKAFNGLCFTHACERYSADIVNEHAKGKRTDIRKKSPIDHSQGDYEQRVQNVGEGEVDLASQDGVQLTSTNDNMQIMGGGGVKKPSMLCKTDACSKQRTFQGYCIAHARIEKGDEVVDEYMKTKSKARCRTQDCQKRMHYKGHCIAHAREVYGDAAVDEHRRGKKAQQPPVQQQQPLHRPLQQQQQPENQVVED